MAEYYDNLGNDYFLYHTKDSLNIKVQYDEAIELSNKAIQFAKESCIMIQLNYEEDWCSWLDRVKNL